MRTNQNRLRKRNDLFAAQYGSAYPLLDLYEREWLEKYVPMSFKIAAHFQTSVLTYEERQQVAFLGICAAMRTYNNKSDEAYWAWRKGCHAVMEAIRTEIDRQCRNPQTESETYLADGYEKNPLDASIEREENEAQKKLIRKMRRAIKKLPDRLQEIMIRVALNGESQVKVAKELGLSQGWVSRLYAQGLEELRERMGVAPKR